MSNSSNSEHLQFIHDRIVNVYGEDKDMDFLVRLRDVIKNVKQEEDNFENYMKFYNCIENNK